MLALFNFATNSQASFTIWDAGGTDTIDASAYGQSATINLNGGTYSSIGGLTANVAIAIGAVIEVAIGGASNDTIIGNSADNTIRGNGGNDSIDGGGGTDSAVFSGLRSAYTLTDLGGGGVRVSGSDGVDTLASVERLVFDDQTVSWPLTSLADLSIGSLALSSLTMTYAVNNAGTAAAANSTTGIDLSTDSTITAATRRRGGDAFAVEWRIGQRTGDEPGQHLADQPHAGNLLFGRACRLQRADRRE